MPSLPEFCQYLEGLLAPSLVTDVCPNGMQIEGVSHISHIATAVSASLKTIETAVSLGVQALIVHHGLFWFGDSLSITGIKRAKIARLLEKQITLFAYHIPLDIHTKLGNNWKAAEDLGWQDLQPFGNWKGIPVGVKGSFSKRSRIQFQQQIEAYYGHPSHCALGGSESVSSAALISGGAHKHITEAAAAGVDCFVTGSFDEPVWDSAFEEKINFYALGHAATEKIGPKALGEHLQRVFSLKYQFIDTDNPF
jgi:dinuclear metal center YbgI/SA1388 family protein